MQYYRDIVDAVFKALTESAQPSVLSLIPSVGASDIDASRATHGIFEFPAEFQPSNAQVHQLPEGEPFLDQAVSAVEQAVADCVFAFPPFLGNARLTTEFRRRHGSLGIAEAVANVLIEQSSVATKAFAFLVPTPFLASMRCGAWRKQFFPEHSAIVIEHDNGLSDALFPSTMINLRLCTVVFTRDPGPIRFFKLPEHADADERRKVVSDLQRLIRQPAGKTQFGYVHQGSLQERYPTTFDFYSEETKRLREEVGNLGERVQLQDVADVLLGFRPCHPERDAGNGITDFLTISARDIFPDGRVDLSELRQHERPAMVQHYLQEGDFCIRQIYSEGQGFVVGVFEGNGQQVTWNSNVIVVRPHASLLPAQRQVLLSFLRSPLAQRLRSAKQQLSLLGGHFRVTPHVLREFPVPIADKEIMTAMEHLSEARAALQTWISEIDDAANAIVKESTASGSRKLIIESGQLARQRFRAATQVEELDYRIRTQFPHPVAYVWRELQVSGPDRYHRLRALTKAAEAHTCFLAQLSIVLSKATDKPLSYIESIATRLRDRPGGTNFGDWFAIVKEVNESRAFRRLDGVVPLIELTNLCTEGHWEPAIRALMDLRNDDSHGRIAPTSVTEAMIQDAMTQLEAVYQSTEFLTDYRLLLITETKYDSIRQLNRFQYLDLTGDNALAPRRIDDSNRNDLESGSLYLRDRQNMLHLMRPLLSYLECPECHQMSTFFLDTFDKGNPSVVGIKSFERNSVRHEPIADDFRYAGLLK